MLKCVDDLEQNQGDPNEMSDDEGITFTEVDEDNLETCVADMDTMLDDYEPIIPQPDEPLVPQELTNFTWRRSNSSECILR